MRTDDDTAVALFLVLTFGLNAAIYGLVAEGAGLTAPLVLGLMWIPSLAAIAVTLLAWRPLPATLGLRPGRLPYLALSLSLPRGLRRNRVQQGPAHGPRWVRHRLPPRLLPR